MSETVALDETIGRFVAEAGGDRWRLLSILQAVQAHYGHVSVAAAERIARDLGLRTAEVLDTASFYAFFSRVPKGRVRIRLSRTPLSLYKGAGAVAAAFERELGISMGGTTADGAFSLDWSGDIGMADQEPAALVNSTVLTTLVPEEVPQIVAALRERAREGATPLAFGTGEFGAALPSAGVASSLVQPGPILLSPTKRGAGLRAALTQTPEEVIAQVARSRLRGRGGAGFPTGMKWRFCRQSAGTGHFVVCNADEGEPGTFKDRVLLTEAPDLVFEGMTIAAWAVGARQGFLYLRAEYAYLWNDLKRVLENRRRLGLLGANICGHEGFDFDIRVQLGAGAYVCGEESALIESLEGKRGSPRDRPPFPTERGYQGQPTVVNNVESFACVARILEKGADWFTRFGTRESTGTKLFSVSGDCERPGLYEVPFGVTVNELLDLVGGTEAAAVQVSGPSGQCVAPKDFGRRLCYEDLPTNGSILVFGAQRDLLDAMLQFAHFFEDESCGWCTPCRVGTRLMREQLQRVVDGQANLEDVRGLHRLGGSVARMSRCGLGQSAPNPILSTMRNFPHLYEARLNAQAFVPVLDLERALEPAERLRARAEAAGANTAAPAPSAPAVGAGAAIPAPSAPAGGEA